MGVKVIEHAADGEIERVWIVDVGGVPEVHARLLGVECVLETKETLANVGVVTCWPIEAKWGEMWPFYVDLEVDGHVKRVWGAMLSRRGLEALQRFWKLDDNGQARAGLEL